MSKYKEQYEKETNRPWTYMLYTDWLEKRLEEAEGEREKIIECFQYLHFKINQLDTGMNNYDIQRVLGTIKKSECFELCKKINLKDIAKRIEPTPGTRCSSAKERAKL